METPVRPVGESKPGLLCDRWSYYPLYQQENVCVNEGMGIICALARFAKFTFTILIKGRNILKVSF